MSNIGKYAGIGALTIAIGVFVYTLSFLIVAGLTYLIFWCFDLTWSWSIALGIWLVCLILRWILSAAKSTVSKGK